MGSNGQRMVENVAVIGGRGFIGSHVVSLLRSTGCSVHALGRCESTEKGYFQVDFSDKKQIEHHFKSHKYKTIYNCAGIIDQRIAPELYTQLFRSIVQPAMFLIEAMQIHQPDAELIHLGSNAEYGTAPCPQGPDSIGMPNSAYGVAKLTITHTIQAKARSEGFKGLIIRPFFVYGPGAPPGNFIEQVINAARKGEKFLTTEGIQTRDMICVSKLAECITAMPSLNIPWGSIVNGCTGVPVTIKSVIEMARKIRPLFQPVYGAISYRKTDLMESFGVPGFNTTETIISELATYISKSLTRE